MGYIGAGISRFNTADELTVTGDAEFNGNANFGDSDKAQFGAGSDLQIYHDSSNSYVKDAGTGDLLVQGTQIKLQDASGNDYLRGFTGGAVYLHHAGNSKFETTSSGVAITGAFTATDGCTITTADNDPQLTLKSTDADANVGPMIDMIRDSGSPADGDELGRIRFIGDDDGGNATTYAYLQVKINDATDASDDGELEILTRTNGNNRSRIELLPTETVFNEDSQDIDFRVESDGNTHMLFVDAGNNKVRINATANQVTGYETLTCNGSAGFKSDQTNVVGMWQTSSSGHFIQFFGGSGAAGCGNIGFINNNNLIISNDADNSGLQFGSGSITPSYDGAGQDNSVDLGSSSTRFKDLYLSGGAYLGGTGSANKLDDYEEGTWTPTASGGYTVSSSSGAYTKIGRVVHLWGTVQFSAVGGNTSTVVLGSAPFTNSTHLGTGVCRENTNTGAIYVFRVAPNSTSMEINTMTGVASGTRTIRTGENYAFHGSYYVA